MIIIVCLDDNNGMCFNHRRQSRDVYLCQRVMELSQQSVLWMNDYSQMLFDGFQGDIRIDPHFLQCAGEGEFCFVEDQDVAQALPNAQKVIVFRWNRTYPADIKFPMHLLEGKWKRTEVSTFPGKSHELITQEVYIP